MLNCGVEDESNGNCRGYREIVLSEDLKLFSHQCVQLFAALVQMIQDPRDRRLHLLERLVPAAQRLLRAGTSTAARSGSGFGEYGGRMQSELRVTCQPLLHAGLAIIGGVVQVEDELLGLGVPLRNSRSRLTNCSPLMLLRLRRQVQVLVVVRAIGPQDVQPMAARAHFDLETLADQQPAVVDQLQRPRRGGRRR